MANSVPSRSKAFRVEGLVLALFCLLAASCDLPTGREDKKGILTIILPGANRPEQNATAAARAIYLPEPVTGNMSYVLDFYNSGESEPAHSIGPTQDKVVPVELEPGFWDIAVTAYYGAAKNDTAKTASVRKDGVEIIAGQENSVSFEMSADEFITPNRVEGSIQEISTTTSDTPPALSVTMHTSTAFSGIDGWTDSFSYQWYWEDEDGTPTDTGSPGSFSASNPGLSYTVDNSAEGTFRYGVKISNTYTYTPPGGGAPTSDSAIRRIPVAEVTVNPPVIIPTLAAITITWPEDLLPESITDTMSYVIGFWSSGESFFTEPTQGKTIPQELEPGLWDIKATAHYGDSDEIAAVGGLPQVEIPEGATTPVSFEMDTDYYMTPSIDGESIVETMSASDPAKTLSVPMKTSTAFTAIPGWTDTFSYQVYYREGFDGLKTSVGPAGSFSSGSPNLSWPVDPGVLGPGTYYYDAEITNTYTHAPSSTAGSVTNTIGVGTVVVNPPIPTGVAITINWPAGFLPESVTNDMSYALEFKKGMANIPVTTQTKTIAQELEPGDWYIMAAAYYGVVGDDEAQAAVDEKPSVEVQAGKTTPVSFTMNADKFLTPHRDGASININRSVTDSLETLSINMKTSTAFTAITGWTDSFSYQVYYREAWNGPRTSVGSGGSFSSGSPGLSWTVDPSALGTGTFYYEADITNTYAYAPPFTPRSVTNTIDIGTVEVASGTSYSVGSAGPGGGTVFYYDPVGFPGPGGTTCNYLEAASTTYASTAGWGADGTSIPGATGTAIGTGYNNTQAIVTVLSGLSETGMAAQLAWDHSEGGQSDWFLPSKDELGELYTSGVVGNLIFGSIWSSTEDDATHAWCGGDASPPVGYWSDLKTGGLGIHPIRAF